MLQLAFGLLAGFVAFAFFSVPVWLVGLLFALALGAGLRWPLARWLLLPVCAWCWGAGDAWLRAPAPIVGLATGQTYLAEGVVRSMPEQRAARSRFVFEVDRLDDGQALRQGRWRLRVSWRDAPQIAPGQRWRLPLRIRPASSYRNPGGWDFRAWLARRQIGYTAYVARGEQQLLAEQSCCLVESWRFALRSHLRDLLPATQGRAVLLALVIGDKSELSAHTRDVFARTGSSHLVAISGLHIGFAAASFGLLISGLWRCVPSLCRRYPARLAGVVGGALTALAYTALAGFALPAQRALIMLLLGGALLLLRQARSAGDVFALALAAVLLSDPQAVHEAGFWLSFAAVAAILMIVPVIREWPWWLQGIAVQIAVSLALYTVLIAFNMQTSGLAPLVNLVVVPLFGFLLVPLALLGSFLSLLFDSMALLLNGVAMSLAQVVDALALVGAQVGISRVGWQPWRWAITLLGVILILIAPLAPLRVSGALALLLAHLPLQPRLASGSYEVTVLDVGQGQSVLVSTRHHHLLFDTGAGFPSGFNLADAVVVPYLRHRGIPRLDAVVLSHGDNDHDGAAEALQRALPLGQVYLGEPHRTTLAGRRCVAGEGWEWDGVRFEFLWPSPGNALGGNNASCVLLLSSGQARVLIPGDIEAQVENKLQARLQKLAPLTAVVAAHHGSLSSSSQDFVAAVAAQHVLFPLGIGNRYGFPKPEVVARWQASGAQIWRSDQHGAVQLLLGEQGLLAPPKPHVEPEDLEGN